MSRACSSLLIPFQIFHFHEIFAFNRKVKCKLQQSREIGLFATLELTQEGVLPKFCIVINLLSTHEYCNLTKFGQDWTENKNFYHYAKFWQDPFLNFANSSKEYILHIIQQNILEFFGSLAFIQPNRGPQTKTRHPRLLNQ